jgi:hypothetical protein
VNHHNKISICPYIPLKLEGVIGPQEIKFGGSKLAFAKQ